MHSDKQTERKQSDAKRNREEDRKRDTDRERETKETRSTKVGDRVIPRDLAENYTL